jgi:MFS family permease
VTLAVITYIDRVCISQAAPSIRADLGLSAIEMGWAFTAFAWAYALFEIPGGWLGDRIGPRRVLMRIVVWWSFFTAATGWIWNLPSLLMTRSFWRRWRSSLKPDVSSRHGFRSKAGARRRSGLSSRGAPALTPCSPYLPAYFVATVRAVRSGRHPVGVAFIHLVR